MEEQVLQQIDFTARSLEPEYYRCTFKGCNFSDMRLGSHTFEECRFQQCNLSLVTMNRTAWQGVKFEECKMTGISFADCNKFSLSLKFERCILHYALFAGLGLQGTRFTDCELCEADFSGANLSRASFSGCDLLRAVFHRTNLEKADFFTARNYLIDPTVNKLRKARFSAGGLEGLLYAFGIEIV